MNRPYLRLSNTFLLAILLVLGFSSSVYGQTASYAISGVLQLTSGTDPLKLSGDSVMATATLSGTGSLSSSTSSSTGTYNGVTGVSFVLTPANNGNPTTINCSNSNAPSIVLTDTVGQPGTIAINNCTLSLLGYTATISATASMPYGYLSAAVPASIPPVALTSANVSFTLTKGTTVEASGTFSLVAGLAPPSITATGSAPPTVTPSPTQWTPTATIGSTTSMTQPITLSSSAPVSFTATVSTTDGGSWLSATPTEGNTSPSTQFGITVNPTGLTQPSYSGIVTLTLQPGSTLETSSPITLQIPVTLTMSAPAVTLSASSLSAFAYTIGLPSTAPTPQTLTISSTPGSASVSASVTSGSSWLSVSPSGGATPANFTVSVVNPSSITTAGPLTGNIQVTSAGATNSPLNIPVTLNVTAPTLTVPGGTLTFNYTIGTTPPVAQSVSISGTSGISFTTSSSTNSGGSWLSATPSGTVPGSVSVSIVTGVLTTPGNYSGSVTVSGPGGTSGTIPVALNVIGPSLTVNPSTLNFSYQIGQSDPTSQPVSVGGTAGITFTATAATNGGGAWLSAAASGTTPGTVTVSVDPKGLNLAANTYTGTVTVAAQGATSQVINVTLVVSATPTISASPSSLSFAYIINGTAPAAQPVSVGGTAGLAFTATAATTSGGNWLSVTSSGTTPTSVSVSVSPSGLTANTYSGSITIACSGGSSCAGVTSQVVNVVLTVTTPTLTISSSSLNFAYQIGQSDPTSQPVSVSGTAGITFTATAATNGGGAWLSAAASGTTPGTVTISVDPKGLNLAANTYTGTVTVASQGATSQVINVTLVVSATPTISASPSSLSFAYIINGTAPAAQPVSVGGTAGLAFTATAATTSGGNWLSVTSSGTTPTSVSVSVNTSGLTANTYSGTITIACSGGSSCAGVTSQVVNVVLTVTTPTLTISSSSLNFAYQIGQSDPTSQPVSVSGTSGLIFTATAATNGGGAWLSAAASGTTPGTVTVSVDPKGLNLAANTYTGTVTVASQGATSQVINVTLVVSATPTISASPSSLSFAYTINGTAPPLQSLSIGGSSGLAFTATAATTSGGSWLSASSGGTTPGSVNVSVNTSGLTANTYSGTITVACSGGSSCAGVTSQVVNVTLVVSPAPTITLSASSLTFNGTLNSTAPASQSVNVTSSSPLSNVSVATEGGSWLSAKLSTASTPAVITISASQANLLAGTYLGYVIVSSANASNSGQSIQVTFNVAAPVTMTATPTDVTFAYVLGGTNPTPQNVSISSSSSTQQVTITTSSTTAAWLSFTTSGGSTPAVMTISVNPSSLSAGTYTASISVSSTTAANSPLVIPVSLVVSNKPTLAASPSSLIFNAPAGGSNPATQSINLTGSSALQFTVATTSSWLSASVSTQTTPATLIASVNTKGMNQGTYSGSITVTSSTAGNSPLTIPVTLDVTAPLVVPGPTISAIVNAASYATTGFSPGAIITIFGSLLGPTTGVSFSLNSAGGVDSTLSGATVTVNGTAAIPTFVQGGQINVILPFNLPTTGTGQVEVQYNDLTSSQFSIPLAPADVQIFTANASGSGPGSILNQDYSVNTKSNPAAPGSVIQVYGTGAGVVMPAVTVGDVAGDKLSTVVLPYSATVNGQTAKVLYAGTAPGLVYGVDQFNIELPANTPSGAVKVVLTVGTSMSQSDVTVFVK